MITDLPQSKVVTRLDPDDAPGDGLVLCDLDGCLISDGMAYPEVHSFVSACGDRLWVVSNNSTDCAADLSSRLANLGWSIPADRILLAGEQTLHRLRATRPHARIGLYASDALHDLAMTLGLTLDDISPEIVLLCRDRSFDLNALDRLTGQLARGAELWVANLDPSHPSQSGRPIAETGALLAAVKAVLGDVPVTCLGKPDPYMAQLAFDRSGPTKGAPLFVGDNPATDGQLARAAGMRFLHINRQGATR